MFKKHDYITKSLKNRLAKIKKQNKLKKKKEFFSCPKHLRHAVMF
jgi:hypothetical protein